MFDQAESLSVQQLDVVDRDVTFSPVDIVFVFRCIYSSVLSCTLHVPPRKLYASHQPRNHDHRSC